MLAPLTSPHLSRLRADERGQGLVEYALIILLVSLVVILGLAALGVDIDRLIGSLGNAFD